MTFVMTRKNGAATTPLPSFVTTGGDRLIRNRPDLSLMGTWEMSDNGSTQENVP
jgi:hypothetical protein